MKSKVLPRIFGKILIVIVTLFVSESFIVVTFADPPEDFSLKWTCDTGLKAYVGPVTKDIDGDGVHEIFIAGVIDGGSGGRVMCIDGSTGEVIWYKFVSGVNDPHCPLAIADLDNDGTFELVHSRSSYGSGTTARNCEDGSIFWDVDYPARYHQFAIADTDENGYPYVYITSDDVSGGNTGRIRKLKGTDGSLVAEHFVWHPCYGGISIADLQGDGDYEILVTDRNFGSSNAIGVQCYNENLELLWNCDEVQCSSHAAVIVDVDSDGVLDVVVMHQSTSNGGIYVIDGSTGVKMSGKYNKYLGLATHCQPAVYDIDKDGNLELITSWDSNPKVWDLGSWSLDKTLQISCSQPPGFANVMGDSDLEIVACSGYGNKIYDRDYDLIYSFPASVASLWSVVQDIDDDGLNEIMFLVNGVLRVYDTLASTPSPQVITDTPYYSERRTATSVFIAPIGGNEPINNPPNFWGLSPTNGETDVPTYTSSLSLTISDQNEDDINWTIETSPEIGSSSGNNEGNGVKYCSVSNLDYSTTYHWFVNATDGDNWKRKIYTFTTENAQGSNPPNFWGLSPENSETDVSISKSSLSLNIADPDGDNFDWSIETSPDIGSEYGYGNNGGVKYCSISNLDYATTYHWFVNATDGQSWNRKTYFFTTNSEGHFIPPIPPQEDNFEPPNITNELNNPPNQPIKPSGPNSIEIGVEYEFSSSSVDVDGDKIRYKFDWDDGETSNWSEFVESETSISYSHLWKIISDYSVKVIAQDQNGALSYWSIPLEVIVSQSSTDNDFNIENIEVIGPKVINQTIVFMATTDSIIDEEIFSINWDFGDGEFGYGVNPSHVYKNPGEYTVILVATDNKGKEYIKSMEVTVEGQVQDLAPNDNPILSIIQIESIICSIIGLFIFIVVIKKGNVQVTVKQHRYNKIKKIDLKINEIRGKYL